jgi:hypothetical protein
MRISQVHEEACRAALQEIAEAHLPVMPSRLDDMFVTLYESAPQSPLLTSVSHAPSIGREALDPETTQAIGILAIYFYPVYRLMSHVLTNTTAETLDTLVRNGAIHEYLEDARAKLSAEYPNARLWIEAAVVFCERGLINLSKSLKRHSKRK